MDYESKNPHFLKCEEDEGLGRKKKFEQPKHLCY